MNACKAFSSLLLLALTTSAQAHHSNTPFDMSRTLETSGVVADANFKNPHSSLTLVIAGEDGDETVTFEGHSLATLRHYGLKPWMVKAGNTIGISYAPRRDGEPGGIFLSIKTQAGEFLDFSHLGYD
jgi:Family of unknown function (DUF6152)